VLGEVRVDARGRASGFRRASGTWPRPICTTSTASVSTKIDAVTTTTLSIESSFASTARKRVSAVMAT
jgi:hypothetical protein